jgi:hypothetical protein
MVRKIERLSGWFAGARVSERIDGGYVELLQEGTKGQTGG